MASYFSTLIAAEAANQVILNPPEFTAAGFAGGRMRYKHMYILADQAYAINEVIRMGTFKSNDRIYELRISCDDMGSTGDFDIGIYLTGGAHDGAVVDNNLFADALDVNANALSRVEVFTEAALDDFDRGKMLWELLGLTEDPVVNYDMTIDAVEATTNTTGEVMLEAYYNSGD